MTSERSLSLRRPGVPTPGHVSRDRILAIGLSKEQANSLPSRLFGALAKTTQRIDYDTLDDGMLSKAMVVLSPLFAESFDAVDLAARLHDYGYSGRYVAATPFMPDHSLIQREVAVVAPDLSFDIVETGRGPHSA